MKNKMKPIKTICLLIILSFSISLFFTSTICAKNIYALYYSGFQKQEAENWCWVATARNMAVSRYYEKNIKKSQSEVAKTIKGKKKMYDGGSLKEAEKAVEQFTNKIGIVDYEYKAESLGWIEKQLKAGRSIYVSRGKYLGKDRYGGHAELIYGYDNTDLDATLIFYNPLVGNYRKKFSKWKNEKGKTFTEKYDQTLYYQ